MKQIAVPSLDDCLPLRWCTGGCAHGPHCAHAYKVDPVDGVMSEVKLCPGNMDQCDEILDDETGRGTGYGFIARANGAQS